MDKNYFPTWNLNSLSSSAQEQPMDCFMNSNWDHKSTDEYNHFGSSLTSMVSSQAANDSFAFREFNGKLGTINNSHNITPPFSTMNMNPSSCFTTEPQNSQNLPAISGDPGFAERAAKFSSFGNRSFNGRTSELGHSNGELSYRSNAPSGKLPRAESTPALKQGGSPVENMNSGQTQMDYRPNYNGLVSVFDKNLSRLSGSGANSNEESSVSEQVLSGETGSKAAPGELNSRKRKATSRGKAKDDASNQAAEAPKVAEADDNANVKRSKPSEGTGSEDNGAGDENQKPAEPFKDYIHVRARRGQATDSHSLAERVRREKISERMKLLQDLVPGCNKVTGKALMLDEIINYVQALQRQVEFLSMKLATVNPRMEGDIDNLVSKDPNASLPQPMYALDSSAAMIYDQQRQQTLQPNGSISQCQMDPFDTSLCRNLGLQLPPLNGFNESLHQFAGLCEDDLQSIVQMGLIQNPNGDVPYHSQGFPGKDK